MRQILLIIIGLSSLTVAQTPRFIKVNGVVIDSKTTLEWQDDYSDIDNGGDIKYATWTEAIDYCEALSLNGKDDWRLPNKNELLSIVDYSREYPSLSSIFENNARYCHCYWTSTTYAVSTDSAWSISFRYGETSFRNKNDNNYVRCVRGGQ